MVELRDGETRDDYGHTSELAKERAKKQREIANGERCEDCGGPLRHEGNCSTCEHCGAQSCYGGPADA